MSSQKNKLHFYRGPPSLRDLEERDRRIFLRTRFPLFILLQSRAVSPNVADKTDVMMESVKAAELLLAAAIRRILEIARLLKEHTMLSQILTKERLGD
jgi:hypothetical protein